MRQAIVLHCDILGFSDKISLSTKDTNLSILNYLKESLNVAMKIIKDENITGYKTYKDRVKYKLFSDNLYVSVEYKVENDVEFIESVWMLSFFARVYQEQLFLKNLLVRGGISYGDDYSDEDIIFSKALIKAYKLETEVAKFPRIVIDNDIIKLLINSDKKREWMNDMYQELFIKDWSNIYFINPINSSKFTNLEAREDLALARSNFQLQEKKIIIRMLNETDQSKNYKIYEKIRWMYELINWIFEHQLNNDFNKAKMTFEYFKLL